jgi:hypothetical protein
LGGTVVYRFDGDGLVLTVEGESKLLTRWAQNTVVDDIVSGSWLGHSDDDGIRGRNLERWRPDYTAYILLLA